MRKTELTKEQQKKFKWLMDAETFNENIEIKGNLLTWKYGIWEDGTWESGIWKYGIWEGGVWESGIWEDGTWKGGLWKGGLWKYGMWERGIWEDGNMWSNLKQKYIRVKKDKKNGIFWEKLINKTEKGDENSN